MASKNKKMHDKIPPTIRGHQIILGGAGSDFRPKLLFWLSTKWRLIALVGLPALVLTVGALAFLVWPKVQPAAQETANQPGQTQQMSAVQPDQKEQAEAAKAKDKKKTTSSNKSTSSTSGGSGSTSGNSSGGSCPNTKHTPGGPDGFGGCWPYSGNTGIPSGTSLSNYTGSCTVTADNLKLTAKKINCDPLKIRATNVKITNSKINGSVLIDDPNAGYSFTITDSEIDVGSIAPGSTDDDSGIGKSDFVATRVNVYGGKRGIWCEYDCTVKDSWIHDQAPDPSGTAHESGIRMGDHSTIQHNSVWCNAPDYPPDAGCSANLTGYGDFAPIQHNTIYRNLFVATTGGVCAYGGSSGDDGSKPYGDQANHIVFEDNVFQRGSGGKCGFYFPITDFDDSRPGNKWINNRWDDGTSLPPAN